MIQFKYLHPEDGHHVAYACTDQMGTDAKKCMETLSILFTLRDTSPKAASMNTTIANSPAMQVVLQSISKMAAADAPVYILGESGTGKELAARAIHRQSARRQGPFQAINCAALPAQLIQSELFGHEKGAFTGAHQRNIGRIEAANGGTIFLDEIGDLPLDLQATLLRFLQENTVERLGSLESIKVDVRVISATNIDLQQAVEDDYFREDLYYRLNVLQLPLPPLRERLGDIELLANYYLRKFAAEYKRNIKGFNQLALQLLNSYTWPGNIRELMNRVRRAVIMCENPWISPADLELDRRQCRGLLTTLAEARAEADRQVIRATLRYCRNNITRAARQLGVSRVTLYKLIEKYGLLEEEGSATETPAASLITLPINNVRGS